jgi:hypothetical protein
MVDYKILKILGITKLTPEQAANLYLIEAELEFDDMMDKMTMDETDFIRLVCDRFDLISTDDITPDMCGEPDHDDSRD